tara:strand:- start:747 stop:1085 length:339 start_codon:yes stop_codon:yes gene_type:complete
MNEELKYKSETSPVSDVSANWHQDGGYTAKKVFFGEVLDVDPITVARDIIGIEGQGKGQQMDFEHCLGPYPVAREYKLLVMSTVDAEYRYTCHYLFNEEKNVYLATLRRFKL